MSFEREITFRAAYDKTDIDLTKNYGIHGVDINFHLKGENGVIGFQLFTGWLLPETIGATKDGISNYYDYGKKLVTRNRDLGYPSPADLGYHSKVPRYEDHSKMDHCDLLEQGFCYYDGTALGAMVPFEALLREGHEGVWKVLEEYYGHWLTDAAE